MILVRIVFMIQKQENHLNMIFLPKKLVIMAIGNRIQQVNHGVQHWMISGQIIVLIIIIKVLVRYLPLPTTIIMINKINSNLNNLHLHHQRHLYRNQIFNHRNKHNHHYIRHKEKYLQVAVQNHFLFGVS